MTEVGQEFLQASLPCLDLVHNLARRMAPAHADAEDMVQETYTRAWAAWAAGKRPTNLAPWLATICLNVGCDAPARAQKHRGRSWPVALASATWRPRRSVACSAGCSNAPCGD